jgi:hypothetical protein
MKIISALTEFHSVRTYLEGVGLPPRKEIQRRYFA